MSEYIRITDRKIEITNEGVEALMSDEELNEHAKGYEAGQSDLYEWVNDTVSEWYQLGITNDKQHIAMLMLLHEVDRKVNYEFKG